MGSPDVYGSSGEEEVRFLLSKPDAVVLCCPVQASGSTGASTYLQAQQQPVTQDAQGSAAAAESFVTQALSQLRAQQGQPVTQAGSSAGRQLLQDAADDKV